MVDSRDEKRHSRAVNGKALAVIMVLALPLGAQTVRGRVFMPDSTTPARGVIVTAIGANGQTAGRALSSPAGDYSIRVSAGGRYELRALQIGFRPTVVAGVDVPATAERVQDIVLTRRPVTLAAVEIRDEGCRISTRDADLFLQLWEQARGALSAARLSEQTGSLDVHLVRINGHVDATSYQRSSSPSAYDVKPYPEIDSLNAREMIVDAAIASTPADTLAKFGYVRRRDAENVIFDMPSADALLSDEFAEMHCFGIAKPPSEHPEWIGVRFAPRKERKDVVDVRGVVWLDRASAELRRVEYSYANLPKTTYEVCDDAPMNVPVAERKRRCEPARDDAANRLGLGGEMDFQRLATGEWLVTSWAMRKPPDEGRIRKYFRCEPVRRQCDPCYYGPRCQDVWIMWPRLVTTAGTIARVTREDVELYRNDSSLALMARLAEKRAGDRPAQLSGRVTDADGRPLAGAIVQTDDPARVARTDSAGAFSIRPLPPGTIAIRVQCRGYQPIQFRLPIVAGTARELQLALVTDEGARPGKNCSAPRIP
jgi:hypothetical protein